MNKTKVVWAGWSVSKRSVSRKKVFLDFLLESRFSVFWLEWVVFSHIFI